MAIRHTIITTLSVLFLTGCQTVGYQAQQGFQQPLPQVDLSYLQTQNAQFQQQQFQAPQMQAPHFGATHNGQQPVLVTTPEDQRVSALTAQLTELQDRLARSERAMLRLDRRMQLVEANELTRMDGAQLSAVTGGQDIQPVALVGDSLNTAAVPSRQRGIGQQFNQAGQGQLVPVAASRIGLPGQQQFNQQPQQQGRALLGLPSLADRGKPASADAAAELSVWTIRYQEKKIWPERAQLKSSRDVVTALRDSTKPVAVYARGKNTASKEFRERVRAISRYLSKVGEQEQVPIAALPAEHLDNDTIEIFTAN